MQAHAQQLHAAASGSALIPGLGGPGSHGMPPSLPPGLHPPTSLPAGLLTTFGHPGGFPPPMSLAGLKEESLKLVGNAPSGGEESRLSAIVRGQ